MSPAFYSHAIFKIIVLMIDETYDFLPMLRGNYKQRKQ